MARVNGTMSNREAGQAWARNLDAQQSLCQSLETLADALPGQFDSQQGLYLARGIYPMLRRIHEFEEDVLFPILVDWRPVVTTMPASLERLRFEHMEDESFAQEIFEALTEYVSAPATEKAVTVAYMLRGLFENLARHIAFEREHLLPLLMEKA
jgi:hypothetical protein